MMLPFFLPDDGLWDPKGSPSPGLGWSHEGNKACLDHSQLKLQLSGSNPPFFDMKRFYHFVRGEQFTKPSLGFTLRW